MAGNKTEKPTRRRLRDARRKGQAPRSGELSGALGLLVSFAMLPSTLSRLGTVFSDGLNQSMGLASAPEERSAVALMVRLGGNAGRALLPMIIAMIGVGAVTQFALVGGRPNVYQLRPRFERINPMKGVKRLLSPHTAWEIGKISLKLAALIIVLVTAWNDARPQILKAVPDMFGLMRNVGGVSHTMFARVAMLAAVIGMIDVVVAHRRFRKSTRMTKQEVREEVRQTEGDPHIRGEIRRRMMRMARQRMMSEIPKAAVVITNPTHYAVALRYSDEDQTPVVVAKGADAVALRIREEAIKHGVPIQEQKVLARALFRSVELGDPIPNAFFRAVAEVLAVVWRTRRSA
jgi:flagellar biosynthetic protein FlhB